MRSVILIALVCLAAGCAASSGSYVAVESSKLTGGAQSFEADGTPQQLLPSVIDVLRRLDVQPPVSMRTHAEQLSGQADALHGQVFGRTATGAELRIDISRSGPTRSVISIDSKLPSHTRAYILSVLRDTLSKRPGG